MYEPKDAALNCFFLLFDQIVFVYVCTNHDSACFQCEHERMMAKLVAGSASLHAPRRVRSRGATHAATMDRAGDLAPLALRRAGAAARPCLLL